VHRRIHPDRPFQFPFDGDLKLELCLREELALRYALQQEFEPDICDLFRRILKPGMVVFDLGANAGQFTLMSAKRVGPAGAVHAFEPAPREFRQLLRNIEINGFTNVMANRLAIGDHEGHATLKICHDGRGLYNSLGRPIGNGPGEDVIVPITTLDGYVAKTQVARVDVLKVDIEGAELLAMRGAAELLSRADAPLIICEFCDRTAAGMGHTTKQLRACLEGFGFRLYHYDHLDRRLRLEPVQEHYDYENIVCIKAGAEVVSSIQNFLCDRLGETMEVSEKETAGPRISMAAIRRQSGPKFDAGCG
jgi:FkbM family methyltransferase